MQKKRVVILGGGISGLAAAYAHRNEWEVVLLEKSPSCGGMMCTMEKEGFFFETGPRTFRARSSPYILRLAAELGLESELIFSSPSARKRYVLMEGKLRSVPSFGFLPLLMSALMRDLFQSRVLGDESIASFAERRFGKKAASYLFDPIALGIFGSPADRISIQSAFPRLKEWESGYGSVLKGFLANRSRRKSQTSVKSSLFSFRSGTASLVQALEKRLGSSIHLEEEAVSLTQREKLIVQTAKREYIADKVVSALPPHTVGHLVQNLAPEAADLLSSMPMTSITVVHLGYKGSILSKRGFGYLVPTREKEEIMGVVFDSEIFPEQNRGDETRLTVMLHGTCRDKAIERARLALKNHLGLEQIPVAMHVAEAALPVMTVGHKEKIAALKKALSSLPQLILVGNYLSHPSVEKCIAQAICS